MRKNVIKLINGLNLEKFKICFYCKEKWHKILISKEDIFYVSKDCDIFHVCKDCYDKFKWEGDIELSYDEAKYLELFDLRECFKYYFKLGYSKEDIDKEMETIYNEWVIEDIIK
jgi:hypothetical protein